MKRSKPTPNDEVMQIRARYYEALRQGMTREKAAALAHGREGRKPAPQARAAASTESLDTNDIPADWRDLPWPQLRALAIKVNGGSIGKMTREDIEALIEAAEARQGYSND